MQLRALIAAASGRLSRGQVATVLLKQEGYNDQEIAEVLGIRPGNVASVRRRALIELRNIAETAGLSPVTSRPDPDSGRTPRLRLSRRTPPGKE